MLAPTMLRNGVFVPNPNWDEWKRKDDWRKSKLAEGWVELHFPETRTVCFGPATDILRMQKRLSEQ